MKSNRFPVIITWFSKSSSSTWNSVFKKNQFFVKFPLKPWDQCSQLGRSFTTGLINVTETPLHRWILTSHFIVERSKCSRHSNDEFHSLHTQLFTYEKKFILCMLWSSCMYLYFARKFNLQQYARPIQGLFL